MDKTVRTQYTPNVIISVLRGIIVVIFEIIFIWTVFLIFGLQTVEKVCTSKEFPLENAGYLIIDIPVILFLYSINKKHGAKIEGFFRSYTGILLPVSLAFLLFWQLYTCYGGYFISGWDAGVIRDTSLNEFYRAYDQINEGYFSWFPNNILIILGLCKSDRVSQILRIAKS